MRGSACVLLVAPLLLAACGGGHGTVAPGVPGPDGPPSSGGPPPEQPPPDEQPPPEPPRRWVAAAGASQDELAPESEAVTDATVRMVLRPTASGTAVRVRLENRMGLAPVTFAGVSVGVAEAGGAARAGTLRRVTFGGDFEATIPPGGRITSDPADLEIAADVDVVVSLYVPGEAVRPSGHRQGLVTSYRTADGAGDAVGDEGAERFTRTTQRLLWVSGLDVLSLAPGAVVALGSSSTDGTGTTPDGYERWVDRLASRLAERAPEARHAVVNAGIGGNTLLEWPSNPGTGPPALARLDADALDLSGATHLILFHGSNDVARGASASQVIDGLEEALARARARGVAVVGATIGPRIYPDPGPMHAVRRAVNDWTRTAPGYAGVVDFDAVLRDPTAPDRLRPEYDSGDGTHPNASGHAAMADAIDLALFAAAEQTAAW